jgi:hypothetical protein
MGKGLAAAAARRPQAAGRSRQAPANIDYRTEPCRQLSPARPPARPRTAGAQVNSGGPG